MTKPLSISPSSPSLKVLFICSFSFGALYTSRLSPRPPSIYLSTILLCDDRSKIFFFSFFRSLFSLIRFLSVMSFSFFSFFSFIPLATRSYRLRLGSQADVPAKIQEASRSQVVIPIRKKRNNLARQRCHSDSRWLILRGEPQNCLGKGTMFRG